MPKLKTTRTNAWTSEVYLSWNENQQIWTFDPWWRLCCYEDHKINIILPALLIRKN